ncbi:MAG TPA: DUF6599 family protein [Pyrinomonadaceae bacterium]
MHLLFKIVSLFVVVLSMAVCCLAGGGGQEEYAKAAKSLPDKIGDFRARTAVTPANDALAFALPNASTATRTYVDPNGNTFVVRFTLTQNDSSAYALLTTVKDSNEEVKVGGIGTASIVGSGRIYFVKGDAFVHIVNLSKSPAPELVQLASGLAEQLDSGENDIPVLIKHLPDWETVQPRASYIVSLQGLKNLLPQQRALDVISFEGGAEAAVANYDAGKLLIIEFNTARIASDNDWNIKTKINELRGAGENANALPSGYRRVGNYSVFVFGAPSEQVANELIDQVKYQQVVQWLGNDPYAYERATREFTETTLGVFVSVVKASGLALVTCLAVGGFFGALLFSRRRARQRNVEAYSDAGGMLRLNLDEMTAETDPARLIGPGVR